MSIAFLCSRPRLQTVSQCVAKQIVIPNGCEESKISPYGRLCENSIGALRLGSGRTVKHFILVTPKPVRAEVLEV